MLADAGRHLALASLEEVTAVFARNPSVAQVLEDEAGARAGSVFWLPLNRNGVEALIGGRFNGQRPRLEHVAGSKDDPEAVYVWLVDAAGRFGRALPAIAKSFRDRFPGGVPVFSRSLTAHSARLSRAMGFTAARDLYPGAPAWLKVALPVRALADLPPPPVKPRTDIHVVRSLEQMMRVLAVRSATYLAEQFCTYDEEFDGNDFCATHFLGTVEGDAAGCVRLRYFGGFAKLERLAVRREYRRTRLAYQLVRAALGHAGRKGFTRVYGHSREDLVRFWRTFGFRPVPDRPPFRFAGVDYREIVLSLPEHPEAIRLGVEPMVSIRPEGAWDEPGPLDLSNLRPCPERDALLARHTRLLGGPRG